MTEKASKLCFVIGPIGAYKSEVRAHANTLLKTIIKPTFLAHFKEFHVERADHIPGPGLMDLQIISRLIEAELVIADLTGRNPNAFYELGIRHMLVKPVLHLYLRGSVIPADVAPYRAIEYGYADKWEIRDAKIALRKMVSHVFSPIFEIETPVTRSAGFIRLQDALARVEKKSRRTNPWRSTEPPVNIDHAPGIMWFKNNKREYLVRWVARKDLVRRGYSFNRLKLWSGKLDNLDDTARHFISDRAAALQDDMLIWARGGIILSPT